MPSPFPGMDPYLESPARCEDFHNKLMGDMERALAERVPARYVVRMGERSYIEFVDPQTARSGESVFKPDLGIKAGHAQTEPSAGTTSVLEQGAVEMEGLVEAEFREVFLEIHELDPHQRLVTGIEVLSPSNKRAGSVGWYQYLVAADGRQRVIANVGVAVAILLQGQNMAAVGLALIGEPLELANEVFRAVAIGGHDFGADAGRMSVARHRDEKSQRRAFLADQIQTGLDAGQMPAGGQRHVGVFDRPLLEVARRCLA